MFSVRRHGCLHIFFPGASDYHLSHALIICDGFQFQPSLYCFTEFVDFKNSFCELNLVLVSRKRLGNVIFGTFLVALRTHLMFADALTKSLPGPAHIQHRGVMFGTTPFGPHDTFSARLLHAEAAAAA